MPIRRNPGSKKRNLGGEKKGAKKVYEVLSQVAGKCIQVAMQKEKSRKGRLIGEWEDLRPLQEDILGIVKEGF